MTACYYCSRPEGAPHLPECPKAPAPRIDWADIRLEESVLAFRKDAEQHAAKVLGGTGGPIEDQFNTTLRPPTADEWAAWHAAHRDHVGYDKAGACWPCGPVSS